ncbi:hypothetical protein PR048_008800 [Dryococelus australis]|uniref:Uncharacterized protein n=1 Tax=Dryococelus australis TaxID=614101 RepID=A0ABQ9HY47_9NEOP|nr:hypothetical protein PR048_008800 [Dryococelus australis]
MDTHAGLCGITVSTLNYSAREQHKIANRARVGIVTGDVTGQRVFSGVYHSLPPLHSGAASSPHSFTLIDSQDLISQSRTKLFTLLICLCTLRRGCTRSPPTQANRAQSPTVSPDCRNWESCRSTPLVSGSSRGSPASPAPSFRRRTIFTPIALIGSEALAVKSRPNLFTHSLTQKLRRQMRVRRQRKDSLPTQSQPVPLTSVMGTKRKGRHLFSDENRLNAGTLDLLARDNLCLDLPAESQQLEVLAWRKVSVCCARPSLPIWPVVVATPLEPSAAARLSPRLPRRQAGPDTIAAGITRTPWTAVSGSIIAPPIETSLFRTQPSPATPGCISAGLGQHGALTSSALTYARSHITAGIIRKLVLLGGNTEHFLARLINGPLTVVSRFQLTGEKIDRWLTDGRATDGRDGPDTASRTAKITVKSTCSYRCAPFVYIWFYRKLAETPRRSRLVRHRSGESGLIPDGAAPGFLEVGIVPDDAAGRRVFLGISHLRPCIPALLNTHLTSPSSILNKIDVERHQNLPN